MIFLVAETLLQFLLRICSVQFIVPLFSFTKILLLLLLPGNIGNVKCGFNLGANYRGKIKVEAKVYYYFSFSWLKFN